MGDTYTLPDWVQELLTPELGSRPAIREASEVRLWRDLRQQTSSLATGEEIYEAIKRGDLLEQALSYADLKFLEANPEQIPFEWKKKGFRVFAWASVARSNSDIVNVPCLVCGTSRSRIHWSLLGRLWSSRDCAGLRASEV